MSYLTKLNLSNNDLNYDDFKPLTDALCKLVQLENLLLNNMDILPLNCAHKFWEKLGVSLSAINLRTLELRNNQISFDDLILIWKPISNIKMLKKLDISNNRLSKGNISRIDDILFWVVSMPEDFQIIFSNNELNLKITKLLLDEKDQDIIIKKIIN